MSKYTLDGVIRVVLCPSIASKAAPTIGEINAGTDLTGFLRTLDVGAEGSTVDAATADSTYNSTVAGTWGGQPITAEWANDDVYANDDAYTALVRGAEAYLAIFWRGGSGGSGAPATGDRCDIWPVQGSTRRRKPYARNSLTEFSTQMAVPTPPSEDVAVVA